MKKIHMIAAMLAMLMPTMALAGGSGSTTYNYSATVNVAASGSGTVYVGAGTSATDKTKQTATQSNSNSSDTSKTYTFTAVAEPEEGYEFTGWTGGADNASSATTPVTVSLSSSTTSKTVDLTATFAKVVSFDGAEYVIDENGGELATLLGTVQAGDKIIINKDVTIEKGVSLTIPSGIQVSISSGKKLIVKGGLSIHTDARLVGEGALAHNWKTITQAADVHVPFPLGTDGVAGTGNGVNTVDGTAGKYLVTSVKDGSATVTGSFTCKEEFFVTVENKASGESFYSKPSTSKPVGVLCTVAREKALNWIEGVSETVYTDCATLLTASATPSASNTHEVKDTNKLSVLLANAGTVSYSDTANSSSALGFAVDLAGCSLTLTSKSAKSQWNSLKLVRFFNGSVTISQKVMNTNFCVYNMSGTFGYLSGSSYYTAISFYDSPSVKVSWNDLTSETPAGGQNYYGGGTYSTTNAKFQTTPKTKFNTVYWGTFASGMNPTSYLYDTNKVYAEQDPNQNNAWVVKSKVVDPNAGQVLINGEESTFADAIAKAPANATIVLQKDVELSSDLTLTATGVRIDLNGWKLTGSNAIINNGDLEIIDVNGNGQIDVPVINNGTLLLSSAKYNGPITLNSGFCYFLEGTFNGGVAVASGVEDAKTVAEVCGGTFATLTYAHGGQNEALVGLCENGYVKDNAIAPIPVSYVTNPSFAAYSLSAFDSTTKSLYTRNATRSGYTREEWITLCKLKAASALFSGFGVDCAVTFDRAIAANDISVNAMGLYPFDIDEAIAANKAFSALFQAMRRSDMATAPWTYGSILPGGAHDGSLSFSLSNKTAQNGTLCLVEMRLATGVRNMSGPKDWSYTEYVTTAKQKLVLGNAGSNKAMIRPATGAATFYATLGAAMDAVADGGTVMLANDCDTALTLNKAGTYTFDTMGFAYSGEEPAVGSGLKIVSQTTVDSSAKVLVPDAAATTYVVENAGTIECGETKYVSIEAAVEASSDDTIAVTVTADDTETVTLPQGKTLTVTVNDGVEANVTVDPGAGAFIETTTSGSTTTYESKQITVEMEEPSAVEVVKVDHGVTNEVSDTSLVNAAVHALTGNHDVSRTDNTDKLDVLDKITVMPAKIVEEVVGDKTIIRSVTFDVVPHLNAGQTLGEGQTLKFRLPVDEAATQLAAIVYHGTAQFGIYPVQTYAGEKFIEVTSADFSPYSYELLDGETSNPIAAIGTTGYASLAAAVAAASAGDTITMLADDTVSLTGGAEITINKSLSITGPVAANGDPLYTIYGKNTAAGYNDIFITGDGTVTLSNVKIAQFGNNAASDSGHAPVYVSQDFTGTVNLGNVYISEFNRAGVVLGGGTFNVTDCYIDCAQSRSGAFTKGIEIKGSATGTVKDTVIVNMERSSTASDAPAGIEVYGNGSIVVDGCTIISDVDPHQSGKATYGIVSSRVGVHDPSGGTLLVTNCSIDVSNGALSVADSDEYGPVNDYTIVVGGEDTYFGNYIAIWSAGSEITINEGEFTEDVYADAGTITITGGTFNNFLPDTGTGTIAISGGIFDAPVAEQYCADGYIPSYDPDTELYTVKQGAYVARNIDTGVGYETLAAAVSAATAGDTIVLLADIVDYTGTALVSKSLTINGDGHSITAAAVPEGGHRDMINAFTGGTSMLKIGGGAVTVTNITFNGHATHAYTYLIEVVNSGASLTVGDISLVNGGELDNSGTPGAGYGAAIHVNNASIVVKDGFYACTGGAEYGVFPFTGILPEGNSSVMFDLVEDSDDTPTVDIDDDLLLVGMIGAIDPDTAQAILDYMQVPSRFIPYTLTLGDGSDYAFTGASPRTWNDIIDYGKKIMDVSTSLGYEGLDKESTPVEVGLLADTELPGTFVFEDANFTVNGNGHELTGTIKYTASAGELKNVILTSDTILDISADGAAVNFGDNVTGKAGEAVTLVVGELSAGQTLATHVDGLSLDSVVLKTWDGDNLVDAAIPEGLVLIKVDGNLIIAAAYEITWVSEGEILAVDVVISNTVPVYAGEPPVKDADDNGIYIFRGWTPKVEAAVSNTTYTANFSNSCTIRWMTGDTIVKSVSVTNGTPAAEIAALAPSGASSPDGNARFAGWSPAVYADALGDADYIAQFEALDTLASIVPGTLRFTAIKVNGRKVAVTFEFKPAGGETDAYRLICKTALDSAETFVSDIANVTLINDDANISIAIAEVQLPEGCENQAFVTGLDFVDVE